MMGRPKAKIRLGAIEEAVAQALAERRAESWRSTQHEADDLACERMRRRLAMMDELWQGLEERAQLVTSSPGHYSVSEIEGWRWARDHARAARRLIGRWRKEDGDEAPVG